MAGAFGGDDEELDVQGGDLDGNEPLEVQDDPAYHNEDDEEPDYHGGEEDDDFEDEDSMGPLKKKLFEMEERSLKNKLKNTLEKVHSRQLPYLTPIEKRNLNKAKQHKNLKTDVTAIDLALGMKKAQLTSKTLSMVAPAVPYILFAFLIIMALMVIVVFIKSIMPWLFPNDEGFGGGGGNSSQPSTQFGVKGKDFYGVRTVYADDELSRTGLLEEYATIIDDTVEDVLAVSKTKEESGKTYTITVTVNLTIPQKQEEGEEPKEYDYSEFNEETFKTEYLDYYNLLNEIALEVYKLDNPTGAVPESLITKLDGILYFGVSEELNEEIQDIIYNKLITLYSINVIDETGAIGPDSIKTEFKNDFENKSLGAANNLCTIINNNLINHNARSEKLFIKDYIFENEEDMMEGISEEKYVAWIFMPNKNVQFEKFSFSITHKDFENFEIKLFNNSSEIKLKKDENNFADLGDVGELGEESSNQEESENASYIYVADKLSESASTFTDIGADIGALSDGVSLAEIVGNNALITEDYLIKNENGIYTYKVNGINLTFKSDIKFYCTEFETLWK